MIIILKNNEGWGVTREREFFYLFFIYFLKKKKVSAKTKQEARNAVNTNKNVVTDSSTAVTVAICGD